MEEKKEECFLQTKMKFSSQIHNRLFQRICCCYSHLLLFQKIKIKNHPLVDLDDDDDRNDQFLLSFQ